MNYSRQHLYALGEPIGDSATKKVAGRVIYGGGGGGGGPTSSTVTQSNIPDWLRPQVEATLGAGMQEMFQTQKGEDGTLQITGMKPFTPYSQDPSNYVAGFSPLQQQAFGNTANLQVPGQFGGASQMATQAGLGGLSTAGQAAGIAGMQAGAGNQYMQMATNPFATQAFMSPYMQNVVNVQQQQAQRQADIANQAMKAGFAKSGFGGRSGIAQSQANADLMRQKQGIQATGLQNAFQQAQQAQQFGADLGLRGLTGAQQGMQNVLGAYDLVGRQGANLANIGGQQLAAQKDIIGMQSQMGGQQQQQQQRVIDQAVQNYAQAQENPLNRLNAFNALLRGYAVPGQTTTSYQAAPPMASQLAGLGMGAYGVSKMMAKGGKVEEPQRMATGGIPAINRKVLLDPDSVSLPQVQQGVKSGSISDLIGVPVALQKQEAQKSAAAMQNAPAPNQPTLAQQALSGIDNLQSNLPTRMAGGGIVAFQAGGTSEDGEARSEMGLPEQLAQLLGDSPGQPKVYSALAQMYPGLIKNVLDYSPKGMTAEEVAKAKIEYMKQAQEAAGPSPYEAYRKQIAELTGNRDTEKEKGAAFLQAGAAMMQPGMTFAQGLGQAGSVLGQKYSQIAKEDTAAKRARAQMEFNLLDAERKERMGMHRDATAALEQARKDRTEAGKAELDKRKIIADLVAKGMTATKPLKAAGAGGAPKFNLNQELFNSTLADLQVQYPGYDPIELRRMAAERTALMTRDYGPNRAAGAVTGPTARVAEEMAAARHEWSFTLEGVQAARLKASKDAEERQRGEAMEKAFEDKLKAQFRAVPTPDQARESATPQAKPTRTKPGAAPAPQPAPKALDIPAGTKPGDLKDGTLYNTPRGVLKWDATKQVFVQDK
jgi:hypothetical protein